MRISVKSLAFLFCMVIGFSQCNRKASPTVENKPINKSVTKKEIVTKPSGKKTEKFESFYDKFHSDSLYQISRVQFPLKGQQIHLKKSSSWKKENWLMIKARAGEIDRNEYNVKILRKDDSYFEGIYCKNCAFSFEMEYKLINGKWYLVYLQEKDDLMD
jgi:hypothetical protein